MNGTAESTTRIITNGTYFPSYYIISLGVQTRWKVSQSVNKSGTHHVTPLRDFYSFVLALKFRDRLFPSRAKIIRYLPEFL